MESMECLRQRSRLAYTYTFTAAHPAPATHPPTHSPSARGRLANFTVTYSFALCQTCDASLFADGVRRPALGQRLELHNAILHLSRYGYSPRNELVAFFGSRFTHSFNTVNPSFELNQLIFDACRVNFQTTPVFIGEFHSAYPPKDMAADLQNVVQMAERSPLFMGISFFEFQVRYDKGGQEVRFSMFGLGNYFTKKCTASSASLKASWQWPMP